MATSYSQATSSQMSDLYLILSVEQFSCVEGEEQIPVCNKHRPIE